MRACSKAGFIIRRCRFHTSPFDTKIESPSSISSMSAIIRLLGNFSASSTSTRLTMSGWVGMTMVVNGRRISPRCISYARFDSERMEHVRHCRNFHGRSIIWKTHDRLVIGLG